MSTRDVTRFTSVDRTADPGFFIHFLQESNKQPDAITWKSSILDGLGLRPGMKVLDVGCGLGDDAAELASLVGPSGHITGIDVSQSLITEAVRRFADRGLPLKFEVGDVQALRFADESFDAVRAERVLMHVPDSSAAVAEMRRVLRRGGRMAALDFDWETQFCDSPYKETTRKIALSFCDGIRNGWIGRSLPRLLREAGMTEISTSLRTVSVTHDFLQLFLGGHVARAVASGTLAEQEADLWWNHLANSNAEGTFFYGVSAFIVAGVKI
jgi:ubiquinone/menaquinone biosynthesis C-methylase UbiE